MVISVDRDYIRPITGAETFSNCDINDPKTLKKIETALNGLKANSVLSDMVFNE
jgi:23S rRNA U2552 (ribose-2'-O)-methylase RlmE/FtsJ